MLQEQPIIKYGLMFYVFQGNTDQTRLNLKEYSSGSYKLMF